MTTQVTVVEVGTKLTVCTHDRVLLNFIGSAKSMIHRYFISLNFNVEWLGFVLIFTASGESGYDNLIHKFWFCLNNILLTFVIFLSWTFQSIRVCWREKTKQSRAEMIAKVSIFLLCLTLASASNLVERCSTLSCVHASAAMITKINYQIDPCEDFYEFACGQFKEEQHTPDEKTTVDTIALMGDKLIEFLLTLLEQPSREDASKLHALARKFYRSCMDYRNWFFSSFS